MSVYLFALGFGVGVLATLSAVSFLTRRMIGAFDRSLSKWTDANVAANPNYDAQMERWEAANDKHAQQMAAWTEANKPGGGS